MYMCSRVLLFRAWYLVSGTANMFPLSLYVWTYFLLYFIIFSTTITTRAPGTRYENMNAYSCFLLQKKCETPEIGTPHSDHATKRYTKVHLGSCLRFSALIGQIGRVPLFGAGPRRYIRSRLFSYSGWPSPLSGVPVPLPGGKKASESRYFLGPFARQNCLRIVRP